MATKRQRKPKITDAMILQWLNDGELVVDTETCECWRNGRLKVATMMGNDAVNGSRYRYEFRLAGYRKRTIIRSRLVYLAGARRLIPPNYEIHHIDGDRYHDAYRNLVCLHRDDHCKFHQTAESAVPF